MAAFYEEVFGCERVPPERDQEGDWLERGTRVPRAHLRGAHLWLPGHGESGPTIEIFQYTEIVPQTDPVANRAGYGHIAFAVDDVEQAHAAVLAAGGKPFGAVVTKEVPGAGQLCFAYVRDPEENLIELQSWK
jgi:catechol 2,3-dioxygenase-like lactoylglutathione lyase family enzyme